MTGPKPPTVTIVLSGIWISLPRAGNAPSRSGVCCVVRLVLSRLSALSGCTPFGWSSSRVSIPLLGLTQRLHPKPSEPITGLPVISSLCHFGRRRLRPAARGFLAVLYRSQVRQTGRREWGSPVAKDAFLP